MTGKAVYRILLTGGPHGGKSTMLGIVQKHLQASNVQPVVVSEAATQVIDMVDENSVPDWLTFQQAIAKIQVAHERVAENIVEHLGTASTTVMVFDRGILDGKVFTPTGHWETVLGDIQVDPLTLRPVGLPAYDVVIHLETCAIDQEKYCSRHRLHDAEAAVRADKKLFQLYGSHAKFLFVPYSDNFDIKIETVCTRINHVLGISLPNI